MGGCNLLDGCLPKIQPAGWAWPKSNTIPLVPVKLDMQLNSGPSGSNAIPQRYQAGLEVSVGWQRRVEGIERLATGRV